MLSVLNLLEPIAIETFINKVYNYFLWEKLYTLYDKNIISIKHSMKNYISVEEVSMIKQGHPRFYVRAKSLPNHYF